MDPCWGAHGARGRTQISGQRHSSCLGAVGGGHVVRSSPAPRVNKENRKHRRQRVGDAAVNSVRPPMRRLHQRISLAVASKTKPPDGHPSAGLHHRKYAISCGHLPGGDRGDVGIFPLPPPSVPISHGAGIILQAEVTAPRTCLVGGPRQVLPCTLLCAMMGRLRGVGAPSTSPLGKKKKTNSSRVRTAGKKKEGYQGDERRSPWTLIPPPTFLRLSLARQRYHQPS